MSRAHGGAKCADHEQVPLKLGMGSRKDVAAINARADFIVAGATASRR